MLSCCFWLSASRRAFAKPHMAFRFGLNAAHMAEGLPNTRQSSTCVCVCVCGWVGVASVVLCLCVFVSLSLSLSLCGTSLYGLVGVPPMRQPPPPALAQDCMRWANPAVQFWGSGVGGLATWSQFGGFFGLPPPPLSPLELANIWVWLKINQEGLHRFWSMFPLTAVSCSYWFVEPQPFGGKSGSSQEPACNHLACTANSHAAQNVTHRQVVIQQVYLLPTW